ncbi:CHASE2 domain-containing protein [Scytonema tolypothrichoides VB-61278]|nr:CHASE2 domain-containing protein [Scytonema tolypothrichoides VB-61278]
MPVISSIDATSAIAKKASLQQILNNQLEPNLAKNRIVLIGTTDPSFNDHRWRTPYSGRAVSFPKTGTYPTNKIL